MSITIHMRKLNLDLLKLGQSGITPIIAAFLVEATIFCLMENGHHSGVILKVEGDFQEAFELTWTGGVTEQMRKSWNDQKEVTEYGATAIAAILLTALTDLEILSRAEQGDGVDYHIGKQNSLTIEGHLEVSGIWKRTIDNTLNVRINRKVKQVQLSQDELPVYIIVTEFGLPQSKIIKHG